MRNGHSGYLVDTNVPVYAYDPTDRLKQTRAIAVLARLNMLGAGTLSSQILGEFFVTVTRKIAYPLTQLEAQARLENYLRSWTVLDVTGLIVTEAVRGLQRHSFSYWDALIWSTAKLNGIPTVLSEDFNNGALIEGVRFLNPFDEAFDPMRL